MKKIGIVTLYHKNYNYGGILQAYAMQRIFSADNCEAQIVDFEIRSNKYILRRVKDLGFRRFIISICRKIVFKPFIRQKGLNRQYNLKIERFDAFMNRIIHTSLHTEENIRKTNEIFDVFVCGSDQVWNPGWWNDIFLLKFACRPKYAYAASIAREILKKDETEQLKDAIKDFEAISVREKQAKDLLSSITDQQIEFVLDPTLLIDRKIWNELAKVPDFTGRYALIYMLENNCEIRRLLYSWCKSMGITVINISFSKNIYYSAQVKYADIFICDAGPEEWLGWVKYANYIFTDSFHGTVFSTIFEKKFWCFVNGKAGVEKNINSRLYSFLEIVGLQERMIQERDILKLSTKQGEIDYGKIYTNLQPYKDVSYGFIKRIME